MPSEPVRTSRLARYSFVAATVTAGAGTAAVADVTSGTFDFGFGRTSGTGFFSGFATGETMGSHSADGVMASLYCVFTGTLSYGNALAKMTIKSADGSTARFNRGTVTTGYGSWGTASWVNAGQFWSAGNTALEMSNQIFRSHTVSGSINFWTNSNIGGTQYVNFKIDGTSETTYGWVQFDWDITDSNNWSVTVSNWAYTSDGPLAAGDTAGSQAVPGLGGLAALAIGAAGLRGRRQRMAG